MRPSPALEAASLVAFLALPLSAQQPTAVLTGRVTDASSGSALAGTRVTLEGPDTLTVSTDAEGRWRATVAPGAWSLRARKLGFAPRELTLAAAAGDTARRDLTLVPAPLVLDQLVVTASRRLQRLADVPVTTELVSRSDIERTGASDLAAVLTEQAGIELQGGHPAGAGAMLQGIGSERVLILLDGQPVAGRISGLFDLSRIPTAVVERVEVVKGPQSTMYGSEAMGGVINIVTRSPADDPLTVAGTLLGGTEGRREGSVALGAARGAFAAAVDLGRRQVETTPGRDALAGALADRTDAAGRLRWAPDSVLAVEGALLLLDERQRWMSSSTSYEFADNRQWTARLGAAWQRGRHRLAPTLSGSSFEHLSRTSDQPAPIAGSSGERQRQRVFEAELLYNAALGAHALDLGVEARREDTESDRVQGRSRDLTTVEPFGQLELTLGRLAVVPGVRGSWNEQWGSRVTPRLAFRYRASDALTLRLSGGTGFRAPDFKELYMSFVNDRAQYSVVGNPDLRPESSRNVTAGAEWAGEHAYARVQAFHNVFENFIETRALDQPEPGQPVVYQYANVDDGRTTGAEVEVGAAAGALRAEAGYGWLDTEDRATGHELLGRPTHSARATVTWLAPLAVRLGLTTVYTGRTPMERGLDGAVTGWRDAYLRADLRLARRIPGGLEAALGADNLFDTRPAQWAGYTGRQIYTSLSWNLGR